MFIFFIGIFSGCSTVSYGIVQYQNGQILQSFTINVDEQVLLEKGYDANEKEMQIKSILDDLVSDLKTDFLLRMVSNESLYNQVMQGVKTSTNVENNQIVLQILFSDATNYRYFYGLTNNNQDEEDSVIVTDCGFYNIITTKTYTQFYNYRENIYYLKAEKRVKDLFDENDFSIEDIDFNYCYGLPTAYKYSSNADFIYSQDGLDIHIWKLSSETLNKEIEFYRIQVKPLLWYVLAVALTFVLLVVLFIVIFIKKIHNKNKYENKSIDDLLKENDDCLEGCISKVDDKEKNENNMISIKVKNSGEDNVNFDSNLSENSDKQTNEDKNK